MKKSMSYKASGTQAAYSWGKNIRSRRAGTVAVLLWCLKQIGTRKIATESIRSLEFFSQPCCQFTVRLRLLSFSWLQFSHLALKILSCSHIFSPDALFYYFFATWYSLFHELFTDFLSPQEMGVSIWRHSWAYYWILASQYLTWSLLHISLSEYLLNEGRNWWALFSSPEASQYSN